MKQFTVVKRKKLHGCYRKGIQALQKAHHLVGNEKYTTGTQRKIMSVLGKMMNLQRQLDR